jgi:hypothetical protein
MPDERKRTAPGTAPARRDPEEEGSAAKRHRQANPPSQDPEEEGSAGKEQA